MEEKRPTRTVPALGKLALKKVAVQRPNASVAPTPAAPVTPGNAPAPAAGPGNLVRRAVVVEPDDAVRNAIAATLPRDRFQTSAFPDADQAYEHIGQNGADLVIVGDRKSVV